MGNPITFMSKLLPVFACLGLNHRTASVELREKFAVPVRLQKNITVQLQQQCEVEECVLLSTCNRTEVYYSAADFAHSARLIQSFFLKGLTTPERTFYLYHDAQALRHLAMVASGLDSMVIGETEIFGQLKDAYRTACDAETVGTLTHRIFQGVFSIGKKVRSRTHITAGPTSVGAAAVTLAQQILGDLSGVSVLVVGAGDVARATAQSLKSRGVQSIFVANRSYDRAQKLAEIVGGKVIRFADWVPFLERADIVVISTAAPVYVVTREVVQQACSTRGGKPLFLIDLSVPRNADPACAKVPGAVLYDIDAMQEMTKNTMQKRQAHVHQGAQLIAEWLTDTGVQLLPPPVYLFEGDEQVVSLHPAKKTDFF